MVPPLPSALGKGTRREQQRGLEADSSAMLVGGCVLDHRCVLDPVLRLVWCEQIVDDLGDADSAS